MDKNEERKITIHWWNFGTKTLDFKGTHKEWAEKRNVKVTNISRRMKWCNKTKVFKGFRFEFGLSSSKVILEAWDDYSVAYDKAILMFLTLLGDKAKFDNGYGSNLHREYKVNWR